MERRAAGIGPLCGLYFIWYCKYLPLLHSNKTNPNSYGICCLDSNYADFYKNCRAHIFRSAHLVDRNIFYAADNDRDNGLKGLFAANAMT